MRILKQSVKARPRISLILLDWGVRESFHLLYYLKTQILPRGAFEVVLIEYYDTRSEAAAKFESEIDTWILLEMPSSCYYHKHLMYNVGIVSSQGEIAVFADSDAMVKPSFMHTIVDAFDRDPLIVYHLDEFRNVRRDFYPFNYPSFEDVLGDGCINNVDGKTKGILDNIDPMHSRNYGACMCARREDLIAIGGADEDLTYLGHICGPYDMTFRLMNAGRRMVWDTEEYLYHTWHPGSDGIANYLGPHDGRNMSTTAFEALYSGRIQPIVENEAIRRLRLGTAISPATPDLEEGVIDPVYAESFNRSRLGGHVSSPIAAPQRAKQLFASYQGHDIYRINGSFYGVPHKLGLVDPEKKDWLEHELVIPGRTFTEIRDILDNYDTRFVETLGAFNICEVGRRFALVPQELGPIDFQLKTDRENTAVIWVDTLREARRTAVRVSPTAVHSKPRPLETPLSSRNPVTSNNPRLVEAVGVCNICKFGRRFAVVPQELGPIDLAIDGDNPDIGWVETLSEARQLAARITDASAQEVNFWAQAADSNMYQAGAPGPGWKSDLTRIRWEYTRLQRRLAAVELGVTGIYQSRTWRTLIAAGGILLRLLGKPPK